MGAAGASTYLRHNLVADVAGVADVTDPNLVNPWGIATSATSPFWVNDGGTGLATVYSSTGAVSATKAMVPTSENGSSPSTPTGIVYNGTGGFAVATGITPAFIFATQNGTVSGWVAAGASGFTTPAVLKVDKSGSGAVYTGLAISSGSTGPRHLRHELGRRFAAQHIRDSAVPAGFAPFNIQNGRCQNQAR